jgi:translation initiation factor IF-2
MGHKTKDHSHHHPEKTAHVPPPAASPVAPAPKPVLEVVIKSDTDGCEQAVCDIIARSGADPVPISVIHKGVGDICKNDVITAATGSRLILGFNVNVLPKLAELCKEENVEVRLYSLIYKLQEDLLAITRSLLPRETDEKILGKAKVIALFKGSRKGIIIGCEVETGRLQRGDLFRVISAMGPVYEGRIESLHIEKDVVSKAVPGQQVGMKIDDFKNVRVGDLVESYQPVTGARIPRWQPSGRILHL